MIRSATTEWSAETCKYQHRPIVWAVGILYLILSAMIAAVTMAASMSMEAKSDCATQAVRLEEQTSHIRQDIGDMKRQIERIAVRQETMNDALQRILAKQNGSSK